MMLYTDNLNKAKSKADCINYKCFQHIHCTNKNICFEKFVLQMKAVIGPVPFLSIFLVRDPNKYVFTKHLNDTSQEKAKANVNRIYLDKHI